MTKIHSLAQTGSLPELRPIRLHLFTEAPELSTDKEMIFTCRLVDLSARFNKANHLSFTFHAGQFINCQLQVVPGPVAGQVRDLSNREINVPVPQEHIPAHLMAFDFGHYAGVLIPISPDAPKFSKIERVHRAAMPQAEVDEGTQALAEHHHVLYIDLLPRRKPPPNWVGTPPNPPAIRRLIAA